MSLVIVVGREESVKTLSKKILSPQHPPSCTSAQRTLASDIIPHGDRLLRILFHCSTSQFRSSSHLSRLRAPIAGLECRTKKLTARHRGDRPALTSLATDSPHINPQSSISDMSSNTTRASAGSFIREHRGSSYPSIPTTSPVSVLRSMHQVEWRISRSRATSPDTSPSRSSSHKRTCAPLGKGGYGRQAMRVRFFSRGRAEETAVWTAYFKTSYASDKPAATGRT